jgi:hypothetical protein
MTGTWRVARERCARSMAWESLADRESNGQRTSEKMKILWEQF